MLNGSDINSKENNGYSPLYIAAVNADEKMVTFLIQHGADINSKNNDGETSLFGSASEGNFLI